MDLMTNHARTVSMKYTPEKAIKMAREPYARRCPECNEILFSPADKISIVLHGKCLEHLINESIEQKEVIRLTQFL